MFLIKQGNKEFIPLKNRKISTIRKGFANFYKNKIKQN